MLDFKRDAPVPEKQFMFFIWPKLTGKYNSIYCISMSKRFQKYSWIPDFETDFP